MEKSLIFGLNFKENFAISKNMRNFAACKPPGRGELASI